MLSQETNSPNKKCAKDSKHVKAHVCVFAHIKLKPLSAVFTSVHGLLPSNRGEKCPDLGWLKLRAAALSAHRLCLPREISSCCKIPDFSTFWRMTSPKVACQKCYFHISSTRRFPFTTLLNFFLISQSLKNLKVPSISRPIDEQLLTQASDYAF